MALHKSLIKKLTRLLGEENVHHEQEDLISYSRDASPCAPAMPDAVLHPGSPEEVSEIVKIAGGEGIAIVPRGSGTGLSGGAVPVAGGLVLHFSCMNRIEEVDRLDGIAVVEPGAVNRQLQSRAAAAGLFFPPNPSSMKVCTLGGNVAENAGGPYSGKYGPTSDFIADLQVVLASGEIMNTGGRARRNVSGYDLNRLLAGSEGTLAVITKITLKLMPAPAAWRAALLAFANASAAGEAVNTVYGGGIVPAAAELIDRTAMDCAGRYLAGVFPEDAGAVVHFELDGEAETVKSQIDRIVKLCVAHGGSLISLARTSGELEKLREARRSVSASLARMGPAKIGEDISVPRSRLPQAISGIKEIAARFGLTVAIFGHAGEGILHPNILADPRNPALMSKTVSAAGELFNLAVELGGTISGEHGIGLAKAPFMNRALDPVALAAMWKIKAVLDPQNILNPGKIFPGRLAK